MDQFLLQQYQTQQELYAAQPAMVKRFLEAQAAQLAAAVLQRSPQARFELPDRVVIADGTTAAVPPAARRQSVSGLKHKAGGLSAGEVLRRSLVELGQSPEAAVATGAELMRYATAMTMVHSMLPAGRTVTYVPADGEELATLPARDDWQPESALTEPTDAIAEDGDADETRGTLQVPFTPFARRFYLPQWVAFDLDGGLLVNSPEEAEAHIASMQHYIGVLHTAIALAPYLVADEVYQQKRYGMLGQLVNQGRALARYQTSAIVSKVELRAAAQTLNRGLRLSLPYFDDQALELKIREMQIIPAGRIMFVPAFVVRAMREERAKVAQDTRLSSSTRTHLLAELASIEQAFLPPTQPDSIPSAR